MRQVNALETRTPKKDDATEPAAQAKLEKYTKNQGTTNTCGNFSKRRNTESPPFSKSNRQKRQTGEYKNAARECARNTKKTQLH